MFSLFESPAGLGTVALLFLLFSEGLLTLSLLFLRPFELLSVRAFPEETPRRAIVGSGEGDLNQVGS